MVEVVHRTLLGKGFATDLHRQPFITIVILSLFWVPRVVTVTVLGVLVFFQLL